MNVRLPFALLFALTACTGAGASGDPGFETGACIEGECFEGLECLSNLCVGPDGSSSADEGNGSSPSGPGSGPSSASGNSDSNSSDPTDPTGDSNSSDPTDPTGDPSDSGDPSDTSDSADPTGDACENVSCDGDQECVNGICVDIDNGSTSGSAGSSTSGPSDPECGDGNIDAGEQCDTNNLGGFTCAALGLGSGDLNCDPVTCTFDTSMCGTTSGGTSG